MSDDGMAAGRKLITAIRKVAREAGVEIISFDLNLLPEEGCEIMFTVDAQAIETKAETASRKEGDLFDSIVGGQDFDMESDEAKQRREDRIEGFKTGDQALRELMEDE